MDNKMLTNKFFKENQFKEISAQKFAYSLLLCTGIEEAASKMVEKTIDAERLEKIKREKMEIDEISEPELLIKYLRKNIDIINRPQLIKMALEREDEIMPVVLKKLLTNDHDSFVENAVRLLGASRENYTKQLMEMYDDIRSPYVKSLVCIVMGLRGEERIIPWMYQKFTELKAQFPDETYAEGPLLGLHGLRERFYDKSLD